MKKYSLETNIKCIIKLYIEDETIKNFESHNEYINEFTNRIMSELHSKEEEFITIRGIRKSGIVLD